MWTHLHVHSQYTLLGGTASIADLVHQAAADGLSALALTDTHALYGAVAFVHACQAAGIRPILGMATTVALPDGLSWPGEGAGPPGRLVLLARDPSGYRSLCKLSSLLQGHKDREARLARGLALDDLRAHAQGLICLGGGRLGWEERLLRAGRMQEARQYVGQLAGIYDAQMALSLELHGPTDVPVARQVEELGRFLGIPTAAVQPIYCLSPADVPRLKLLAAIDRNCPLDELPGEALPDGGDPTVAMHWLGPSQMAERFAGFAAALERSGEIAARCEPSLWEGRQIFPVLHLPDGQRPEEALAELARAGLADRYGALPASSAAERLDKELAAVARHGYAPLFLVVADIVRFAHRSGIPVSTRGSVANSLVAYCTGITTVDPVLHNLLFERFLSPARADPPDIDLDFCSRRRDEVLAYVRRTYGEDRVSLVATVSTLQLRSAVRETAKAHGWSEERIGDLVADLPRGWHPDPRRRDSRTVQELIESTPEVPAKIVLREASALVGMPHHLSVHPGGVVITPGPLTDWVPVQWSPKGFLITQFGHKDVEALGLSKLDLLGIRALTVLSDATRLVRRHHDPDFRLEAVPLDDPQTAAMLARGDTVGVFQCESSGARSTLIKLRAHKVDDLAVANAFFKPGPSLGGMARAFVRRYRKEEQASYLHECLKPILGPTMGVLIFQEQILRIAVEIAGLSWAQADQLRRGIKFRADEIDELEVQFVQGCQRPPPEGPGMSLPQAQTLWQQIVPFSGYGFNQGHAMAYADVSYRSAYLKAHWPAAFLCARLMNWGGFHHPAMYMAEAIRLGIEVRVPHVNHSERGFSLSWEGTQAVLWMGLGWVRDLRRSTARAIVAERHRQPFADLRDLAMRVALQRREMENLIRCGALDGLGTSRAALLAESKGLPTGRALQLPLGLEPPAAQEIAWGQCLAWEKQTLGHPISALREPLKGVEGQMPGCVPLRALAGTHGRPVTAAGIRLPSWTGGKGFYLWDGQTWAIVRGDRSLKTPPPWTRLLLCGHWASDEWGLGWFQIQDMEPIADLPSGPSHP